jgi:tellurite resistance protein TerA
MQNFVRGQKSKLDAITPSTSLEVAITFDAPAGWDVDLSCFGLDASGKLSDENYFVFYNQKRSPCGSLEQLGPRDGFQQVFRVDVAGLPSTVQKLVFAATIDGSGTAAGTGDSSVVILSGGNAVARYDFSGDEFGQEKAIMMFEVYLKTVWRVAAVGQGFNGGLSALLAHFGGQEDGGGQAAPPPPSPPTPAAAPPPPPPPPPKKKVSLGKVTLDKRGSSQKVSLKKGGGGKPLHINLNWDNPNASKKKGFLSGLFSGGDVDLDLGCMFEMVDGQRGVIQPLGGNFGSRHTAPYIHLDQDDRSGASDQGENMYIFRADLMRRIVIFAMIYEGGTNFTQVNGRVTVDDGEGTEILVRMDAPDASRTFCAVCLIENQGGSVKITKEERYYPGHQECDQHYGFGFRWRAGSK